MITNDESKRIDLLRTIAIITVILIHVTAIFTSMTERSLIYYAYISIDVLVHFAVPLFVFISGYALSSRYKGEDIKLLPFFKKRILRVIPSYVILSAIYYYLTPYGHSGYSFLNVLITGRAAYHLYFIIIILQLYLVFPLLAWINQKINNKRAVILIIATFVAQIVWYLLWLRYPTLSKMNILFIYLPFFMIGIEQNFIKTVARKINVSCERMAALVLPLITAATTVIYLWIAANNRYAGRFSRRPLNYKASESIAFSIFSLIAIILLFVLSEKPIKNKKIAALVKWLGGLSYEIYLFHVLVLYYAVLYLPRFGITPENYLYLPLASIITLAGGTILAYLYKKTASIVMSAVATTINRTKEAKTQK